MFVLENDIPIPASRKSIGVCKYPWEDMKIGQSFFVPLSELTSEDARPSPPDRLKKTGYRVQTRKLIENGVWGVRVWRIN